MKPIKAVDVLKELNKEGILFTNAKSTKNGTAIEGKRIPIFSEEDIEKIKTGS